jgi:Tfp pilus assembly protein PilX
VPTWLIIVLVVLVVLAIGGMIARAMLQKRTEAQFRARLSRANHDLAEAAAVDRGWDRATLESATRSAYAEQRGAEPAELLLVEVLDRPGTEQDVAVFRVEGEGRRETLTLGRREGEWVNESLA